MSKAARTPPSLPAHDPAPAARGVALAAAREAYAYDFSYAEQCFIKDLPAAEHFPPPYLARAEKLAIEIATNRAASSVSGWTAREAEEAVHAVKRLFHAAPIAEVWKRLPGLARRSAHETQAVASPDPLEPWRRMFPTLRTPLALASWKEDWCFGWQRVAGPCPVVLQRLERLPAYLPIGDAHLAHALAGEGLGVGAALAQGRLYVADYAPFAGLRAGQTDGRQKYVWAPVALFVSHPGGLAPVAIQVDGHGGTAATLVGPTEGERWMLARAVVQTMDESHQGVITHVGVCHMVVERFILAARRQLAPWHPLMRLFAPHFENTLAVNQVALDSVVSPGGSQDRLLAPLLEDQMTLLTRSVAAVDFASLDPTIELARRGVHEPESLPSYPFRDDSLPLWWATRDFVAEYVALYYPSDAEVAADGELAAFVAEIGAADGGRLPGLMAGFRVATVGDVVELATRIVFRASTWHAAINDSSYDWVSFAPNMPSAPFAPFPAPGAPIAADALARMLPTVELNWEVVAATYNVAEIGRNRLGRYDEGAFEDARVPPLVERFQARLESIESETAAKNRGRPVPYEYLLPSNVTASINA